MAKIDRADGLHRPRAHGSLSKGKDPDFISHGGIRDPWTYGLHGARGGLLSGIRRQALGHPTKSDAVATSYSSGWETFLGNAGVLQLFANGDPETLRYAAGQMEKLISPSELRIAFSRQRNSQLLLMEGLPPAGGGCGSNMAM